MKTSKFFLPALLAVAVLAAQFGSALAAPAFQEEAQHPVAAALAEYFKDITDYDAIIGAHEDGFGFGVIAQALFLTVKLEGDSATFLAILEAKESGDYSAFFPPDEDDVPTNWGQFRKAISDEKCNLGGVMSGNGKCPLSNAMSKKDKDHGNNGNGGGGGQGNGNGGGGGQGNGGNNGNGGGNGGGQGNGNGGGGGQGNGGGGG